MLYFGLEQSYIHILYLNAHREHHAAHVDASNLLLKIDIKRVLLRSHGYPQGGEEKGEKGLEGKSAPLVSRCTAIEIRFRNDFARHCVPRREIS